MPPSLLQPRWLRQDAVALQLQEANGNAALFGSVPEPERAAKCLVGLCFYRFDPRVGQEITNNLQFYSSKPGSASIAAWFLGLMMAIENSPQDYPFCLSEKEIAFYAKQNFGDEINDIEGIYHPPSFYQALAQDIVGYVLGVIVGAGAVAMFPEAAAGATVGGKLAPRFAQVAAGNVTGSIVTHLIPGDAWDAATKSRRWRRYELDWRRRQLR